MKIDINLSKADVNKLLAKYGYRQGKIAVYYNMYGDDKDLFEYGGDGVHHYFADVAWNGNEDKPQCLCAEYPTMETIKDYLLEKVVNDLFLKSLLNLVI